jgi:hypothetical protein
LCDLRSVSGFLLEFVQFLDFFVQGCECSGGGLWCSHGGVMVFLPCDLWALDFRLFLRAEMEMAQDRERERERPYNEEREIN